MDAPSEEGDDNNQDQAEAHAVQADERPPDDFRDAGANLEGFVSSAETYNVDREYMPDPNDLAVERCLTRMEYLKQALVIRNYCTNKQAREEWLRYKEEKENDEKVNPPQVPEPVEWVADDLYGSVVGRRGPTGPNPLEVIDPNAPGSPYPLLYSWQHVVNSKKTERPELEPIILPGEEEYYIGSPEPRSPPPEPLPAPPTLDRPIDPSQPSSSTSPGTPQRRRSSLQNLSENERLLHTNSSMAQMSLNDAPPPPNQEPIPKSQEESPPSLAIKTEPTSPYKRSGEEDPELMFFYEEEFCLIPGDVIIFSRPRVKQLANGAYEMMNAVCIYEDILYFKDFGTYRANFLEGYPLEAGDLVVRFGNFNRYWMWNRHPTINFYMYWPGLIPPSSSGKKQLHPWYWIDNGLLQYGGDHVKSKTLPITESIVEANTPIWEKVPNFKMRNGDVLIHHVMKPTNIPPFDHKLITCTWNPILEGCGINHFVDDNDRVLRHGMDFQVYRLENNQTVFSAIAHVELYIFDDEKNWRYLGRWTSRFDDHVTHSHRTRPLSDVPLAGDVIFDRNIHGRVTKGWDSRLNIGGLICFHENELWKDFGRENRPFVWYKDVGKYGLGDVTMVLRYGSFEDFSNDWTWRENKRIEIYILNTRGSSWRRAATEKWPSQTDRPKPNYNWKPYNPSDIFQVDPKFQPQFGDVILRLHVSKVKDQMQNPVYAGVAYNPHYDTKVRMCLWFPSFVLLKGDYVIRAGYEKNGVNPKWINATVEAYQLSKSIPGKNTWKFKGRDMFIYGTNYLAGGLKDVEKSGVGDLRVSDIQLINDSKTRQAFGRFR